MPEIDMMGIEMVDYEIEGIDEMVKAISDMPIYSKMPINADGATVIIEKHSESYRMEVYRTPENVKTWSRIRSILVYSSSECNVYEIMYWVIHEVYRAYCINEA